MCELCKLEKKTHWYYEDSTYVILDCETCKVPMIVFRQHTMQVSFIKADIAIEIIKQTFGDNVEIRFDQRKIKDHLHWHIIKR